MKLADGLIAAAPPELRESLSAMGDLERDLAEALARARSVWPDVRVSDQVFVAFVGARVELGDGALSLPLRLAEDLYLACACASGDGAAIRAFQQRYEPHYRSVFERMGLGAQADDLGQLLLRRLFIREPERPPAILNFSGRGALGKWIKVLAAREGHRYLEGDGARAARTVHRDPDDIAAALGRVDPEVERLKEGYRAQFKEAFAAAFDELPERERNLFRLQYLDGLNLDRMAAVYNVGRATVARWRTRSRERLLELTRAKLAGRLGANPQDFESIMRFIDSRLDLSLSRLLRKPDGS